MRVTIIPPMRKGRSFAASAEIAFGVVASSMRCTGSCWRERSSESGRSEGQDSEFDDLRVHFAGFVASDVDDLVVLKTVIKWFNGGGNN